MYLFFDERYRVYKSKFLSGQNRNLVKQGKLTCIELRTLKGMNIDGTWSDIQDMPVPFDPETAQHQEVDDEMP